MHMCSRSCSGIQPSVLEKGLRLVAAVRLRCFGTRISLKPFSVLPSAREHHPPQPQCWSCDIAALADKQTKLPGWTAVSVVSNSSLLLLSFHMHLSAWFILKHVDGDAFW